MIKNGEQQQGENQEPPKKPEKPAEGTQENAKPNQDPGGSNATGENGGAPTSDTPVTTTTTDGTTQPSAATGTTEATGAAGDNNQNKKIKFSIGLDNIASANAAGGSSTMSTAIGGGLGGHIERDGYVSDASLKQIGVKLTTFNNVPLMGPDKKYHLAYDEGLVGGAAGDLCAGRHSHPQSWEESKMEAVKTALNGGSNFKVGGSWSFNLWGEEYFKHFYPDLGLTKSEIFAIRNKYLLNIELIIPTGGGQGKALRMKVVDDGPNEKDTSSGLWIIDVMVAFAMLNEVKDIFTPSTSSIPNLNASEYTFEQGSATYDFLTGEIPGYGPDKMIEIIKNNNHGESINLKGFGVNGLQGECRAKFFIDPSHREQAEKIVNKKLPDELFTCNATYGSGMLGSAAIAWSGSSTMGAYGMRDELEPGADPEYVKALLAKPIVFSDPVLQPMEIYTDRQMMTGVGNKFWGTPRTKFEGSGVPQGTVRIPDGMPFTYRSFSVNAKIVDRIQWVFNDIWKHYSQVQKPDGSFYPVDVVKTSAKSIFISCGCCADRPKRGGTNPSIHSWCAAIDFDCNRNAMKSKSNNASLSKSVYKPFWEIWYHYGFYSLGIEANYDWMHVQAFSV